MHEAAVAGELDDAEGMRAQALRLLADPAANEGLLRYFAEYTQSVEVTEIGKDAALFPEFDAALAQDMEQELFHFVAHVLGEDDARFETLMSAPYSIVSPRLAAIYGVTTESDGWAKVELPPDERAGLLTQGAILATQAGMEYGDPVLRGKYIRERILCTMLPPPPPNIPPVPEPTESSTMRERLEQHTQDPLCAGCHQMMDPLGLPLERYDALGRFRLYEGTQEIDPSGTIHGLGTPIEVDDAIGLAREVAVHPAAQACFVESIFYYAYGRAPTDADACELEQLQASFAENDGDVLELVLDTVSSPHFVERRRSP